MVSKHFKRRYRGNLRQTMVDSWYCLDPVVPVEMSQVSKRYEVGIHKWCTRNTRLSFGTSAGTFACPVGPYRNCKGEVGTKNEPNWYFVPDQKKGPKIDPHVSNLRSRDFFFKGFRSTINFWTNYWIGTTGEKRYFGIHFLCTVGLLCLFLRAPARILGSFRYVWCRSSQPGTLMRIINLNGDLLEWKYMYMHTYMHTLHTHSSMYLRICYGVPGWP